MQNRFYVYTLTDPRDGSIFYVGKGCGDRMQRHVAEHRRGVITNAEKYTRIDDIWRAGLEVRAEKVEEDLTEPQAFAREKELILEIGYRSLTNISPGQLSAMEKSKLQARADIRRLKSMEQWLAEKPRSQFEIDMALSVRSELERIAIHGQVREIIVTKHGVEFR